MWGVAGEIFRTNAEEIQLDSMINRRASPGSIQIASDRNQTTTDMLVSTRRLRYFHMQQTSKTEQTQTARVV